jgi:hypothetical protein
MTEINRPRCEMDPGDPFASKVRQRRRLFIGGGVVASSITVLWNRPSFGASTACTHSVWKSHLTGQVGFLSHGGVPSSGCGDTPACWAKSNGTDWKIAGGGLSNFDPTQSFSGIFNTTGWTLVGTNTLLNALKDVKDGGLIIQKSASQKLPAALCAQIVAGLLNANWYQSAYDTNYNSPDSVVKAVNSILSLAYSDANTQAGYLITYAQNINIHTC